jgi:hypothetical protein
MATIGGFPQLSSVGTLDISENAVLVSVQIGSVAEYRVARIVCNSLFSEAPIAAYLGARGGPLELRGNLDSSEPCN